MDKVDEKILTGVIKWMGGGPPPANGRLGGKGGTARG